MTVIQVILIDYFTRKLNSA